MRKLLAELGSIQKILGIQVDNTLSPFGLQEALVSFTFVLTRPCLCRYVHIKMGKSLLTLLLGCLEDMTLVQFNPIVYFPFSL